MTRFRVKVEADHLARVMGNALAFFPARSPIKTAQLRVYPDRLVATGTDTYTLGRDECPIMSIEVDGKPSIPVEVETDHAGWKEIEAQARKDKGNTGLLEYLPGDCLTYYPGGNKAEVATGKDETGNDKPFKVDGGEVERVAVWGLCDELLQRVKHNPTEAPEVLCFDPSLLGRFGKVKLDAAVKAEKVVDFVYQGAGQPLLAKVGPTFLGMLMPIDRDVYAENQDDGQEGLW